MSTRRRRQSGALRRFRKQLVAATRDASGGAPVEGGTAVIQQPQPYRGDPAHAHT